MADQQHALMQRIIETWNARDEDGFVGCYTDPMLVHDAEGESISDSRDRHREAARSWWSLFPDLTETIDEIITEGDRVFLRTTSRGTLASTWRGIAPTGDAVSWECWYVYRIQDDLVAEERTLMDLHGLLVRLGGPDTPGA